jgi:UDP-galactopyranose mutase
MLHMDSWEMGAQNRTPCFREEFTRRRGYDPQPYYPVNDVEVQQLVQEIWGENGAPDK